MRLDDIEADAKVFLRTRIYEMSATAGEEWQLTLMEVSTQIELKYCLYKRKKI